MEIDCPWCGERVRLHEEICPACKLEVLPEHLVEMAEGEEGQAEAEALGELDREENETNPLYLLEKEFQCGQCGHDECRVKEVAMTGAGLSKLLDIQHNHYWFASCLKCGVVKIYDPEVLRKRAAGGFGTALDILF
ncbi:zinc ribbon domain-containing protein [Paenibacillus sp. HB172176]|uniref:zinc ribbon domain-containing protein n=1 Tax=Paenibacillus sp. HB172176 TaxID=2493690 RepID=UPI00143B97B6|nr:zinc ribbon domain-containing protein [Paenibacillus sp. HB172176]